MGDDYEEDFVSPRFSGSIERTGPRWVTDSFEIRGDSLKDRGLDEENKLYSLIFLGFLDGI